MPRECSSRETNCSRGSVGRTDLPGGDWNTLLDSMKRRVLDLADEVRVLPGHGPETTIGTERRHNPSCGRTKPKALGRGFHGPSQSIWALGFEVGRRSPRYRRKYPARPSNDSPAASPSSLAPCPGCSSCCRSSRSRSTE